MKNLKNRLKYLRLENLLENLDMYLKEAEDKNMSRIKFLKYIFGAPRGVLKPEVKVLTWRLAGDRANRKHYPVHQESSFELMEGNHMSYA